MGFGILLRRDSGNERCPRCNQINVNLVIVSEGILGCFECGSVFLTKRARVEVREQARLQAKSNEIPKYVPGQTWVVDNSAVLVTSMGVGLPGEEPLVGNCGSAGVCPAAERIEKFVDPFLDDPMRGVKDDSVTATELGMKFSCTVCGKVCKNRIGLSGHMRSHRKEVIKG